MYFNFLQTEILVDRLQGHDDHLFDIFLLNHVRRHKINDVSQRTEQDTFGERDTVNVVADSSLSVKSLFCFSVRHQFQRADHAQLPVFTHKGMAAKELLHFFADHPAFLLIPGKHILLAENAQ